MREVHFEQGAIRPPSEAYTIGRDIGITERDISFYRKDNHLRKGEGGFEKNDRRPWASLQSRALQNPYWLGNRI